MSRDSADQAAIEQEFLMGALFKNQQEQAKKHASLLARFTGKCLYCESPIETGRYCDTDCQSDHEKMIRHRSQRAV